MVSHSFYVWPLYNFSSPLKSSCSFDTYFWSSRSICTSKLTPSYDLGISYLLLDFWFVSRDIIFNALLLWRWTIILQDANMHPSRNDFPEMLKNDPCNILVKELASINDVLQYLIPNYFLSTRSLTKTYLMKICLELPVHEFLPLLSILIALSLYWYKNFLYRA